MKNFVSLLVMFAVVLTAGIANAQFRNNGSARARVNAPGLGGRASASVSGRGANAGQAAALAAQAQINSRVGNFSSRNRGPSRPSGNFNSGVRLQFGNSALAFGGSRFDPRFHGGFNPAFINRGPVRFNAFGTRTVTDAFGNVFEVDAFGNSRFVGNRFGSSGFRNGFGGFGVNGFGHGFNGSGFGVRGFGY